MRRRLSDVLRLWRRDRNLSGIVVMAVVLAILPLVLRSSYFLSTMILVALYGIVTIGLCLLMGYAGQISLGHSAFFGLGAYGSAILTTKYGLNPWLAMAITAPVVAGIAYVIGGPIFRLKGHYLAMGTLAFGFLVHILLNEWKPLTGGPTGIPGIPTLVAFGFKFRSDRHYYYLTWAVTLAALVLALNVVNSRFGRALRSLRGSEVAAESLGIEVNRYKLQVLALSAGYASVAGSLYAHYMSFVSPGICSMDVSIRLILMAAVGGLASVWGAPFGTLAVTMLTLGLRELVSLLTDYGSGEYQIIAYGALLVAIMVFYPQGLVLALMDWWREGESAQRLKARLSKVVRRG